MAVARHHLRPGAHWPVVLGLVRTRTVAARIAPCGPAPPAHGLSAGRGVAALLRAMLEGHHALATVGARLGPRLETRGAAPHQPVVGAVALRALAVSAIPTPGRHQETTTRTR